MVVLVVVAVIVIPTLIRSGGSRREEPLTITENGADGTTSPPVESSDDLFPVVADTTSDEALPGLEERLLRHTVSDGESITDVASALGVSVRKLLTSNRLFGKEQLQPGQTLYASREGVLHIIQPGQTLTDISITYAVPVNTITKANGITSSATIYAGDRLLIPGVTTTFWDNVVTLSEGVSSRFIWPLRGEVVSTFGPRVHPVLGNRHHHDGIDIDVPEGTTVHAAAGGEVYYYGEQPGYGNVLILEHTDGYYTMYGHLLDALVTTARRYVEIGQEIALSGNTGISSGPHLHFEIRHGEFPIDPLRYLP